MATNQVPEEKPDFKKKSSQAHLSPDEMAIQNWNATLEHYRNEIRSSTISPERKRQIRQEIAAVQELIQEAIRKKNLNIQEFQIFAENNQPLSPQLLATTITPFLYAISDLQNTVNEILARPRTQVKIKSITQNSPISVNLEGAGEAIQVVQEMVVPWRRKHSKLMAQLAEQEKVAEIETKNASILQIRASTAKDRAERDVIAISIAEKEEVVRKLKLENEKLELELRREKIQLAIDIINQLCPNLSETDRIAYVMKLLLPLDTILSSSLEIVIQKPKQ